MDDAPVTEEDPADEDDPTTLEAPTELLATREEERSNEDEDEDDEALLAWEDAPLELELDVEVLVGMHKPLLHLSLIHI